MQHDDDETCLYVGNLSSRTRCPDLEGIFSAYGKLRFVNMNKHFAFVVFGDPHNAYEAICKLNGREVDGQRMVVELATQVGGSGSGSGSGSRSRRCLTPLGYFAKPSHVVIELGRAFGELSKSAALAQFVYHCDEGKKLKEGSWGYLDESLSFLGHEGVEIVGSSNGVLLCCTNRKENLNYIICNPVTREFRSLPELEYICEDVAVAFLCSGDATSLDGVEYEVVRALVEDPSEFTKVVEIDTFSSYTNKWSDDTRLVCASEFRLVVANVPGFAIKDVIFWHSNTHALLAYDRTEGLVTLVEAPPNDGFQCQAELFGKSGCKIQYARHNGGRMQIWVLENFERGGGEWMIKHEVSFREMSAQNDYVGIFPSELIGFHPNKPHMISVRCWCTLYWYDMGSKQLEEIGGFHFRGLHCDYFLYEYSVDVSDG